VISGASALRPWAFLATFWGLAFCLACHLATSQSLPAPEGGMAGLLMGESRQAVSLNFFNTADQYFHKGVAHRPPQIALHGIFRRWEGAITPEQHAHAEGADSAEILPWLKLATRTDPHNVEAFLVAAFWASTGLHRSDLADEILAEAQRSNPADYRIPLEKGRMAIRASNFDGAEKALSAALALIPADSTNQQMDRAEILTFLGFLREAKGVRADALLFFKNALAIFPERAYINERVALLEAGTEPPESAAELLRKLTQQTAHDACKAGDGDHDHNEGDHND